MKKTLFRLLAVVLGLSCALHAQTPPVTPPLARTTNGNFAGLLYASNFGQWQVPQGNLGTYSWNSSSYCYANTVGVTFLAFQVGTPITIVDTGNPSATEIVTPSAVTITQPTPGNTGSCAITIAPVNPHTTYHYASATAGLQETLNWAGTTVYNIALTPDWALLGGTEAMISAAQGNANVTLVDFRTANSGGYVWNGFHYTRAALTPQQLGTLYYVDGFPNSCSTTGVISVTGSGGSGLTVGNFALSFSGGGGYGAYGYLNVTSSTAYTVVITDPGTGYTSAPTVTFPTTGTAPTLTATIGTVTSSTQPDCAMAAVKPIVDASCLGTPPYKGQNATLIFGTGVYTTNAGFTLPQNVCGATINPVSDSSEFYPLGQTDNNVEPATIIRSTAPISTATVYSPPKLAIGGTNAYGGNSPTLTMKGISIDDNFYAPSALWLYGCYSCNISEISGGNVDVIPAATPTGTYTAGSYTIALSSGTNTANGQDVHGLGIPVGDTIQSGGGTTSIVIGPNPATLSETSQQLSIGIPQHGVIELTDVNGNSDGNGGFGGNAWNLEQDINHISASTGSGSGGGNPNMSATTSAGTITAIQVVNQAVTAWSLLGGANGNAIIQLTVSADPRSIVQINDVYTLNGFTGGPTLPPPLSGTLGATLNGKTITVTQTSSTTVTGILYQVYTYSGGPYTEAAASVGTPLAAQNFYAGGRLPNGSFSCTVDGTGHNLSCPSTVWNETPWPGMIFNTSGFTSSAINNVFWTLATYSGGTPMAITATTTASVTPGTYTGTNGTYGSSAYLGEVPSILFPDHTPVTEFVHNTVPVNGDTVTLTSTKSASTVASWTGTVSIITVTNPANIIAGMTVTGPGIAANTTVSSLSGVTVTLNQNTSVTEPLGVTLAFTSSTATTVTYVSSGATGNQINIAGTVPLQTAADYTFFSGSADTTLVTASYSNSNVACTLSQTTTVMTVTGCSLGIIVVGSSVSGVGITTETVSSLGTGTGGAGTYNMSVSQTITSTTAASITGGTLVVSNNVPGAVLTLSTNDLTTIGLVPMATMLGSPLAPPCAAHVSSMNVRAISAITVDNGCVNVGPFVNIVATTISPTTYGIWTGFISDSGADYLTPRGVFSGADLFTSTGTFRHSHPYGGWINHIDNGYGLHLGEEIDTPYYIGVQFTGSNSVHEGDLMFAPGKAGVTMYSVGSVSGITITNPVDGWSNPTQNVHNLIGPSGPVDLVPVLPYTFTGYIPSIDNGQANPQAPGINTQSIAAQGFSIGYNPFANPGSQTGGSYKLNLLGLHNGAPQTWTVGTFDDGAGNGGLQFATPAVNAATSNSVQFANNIPAVYGGSASLPPELVFLGRCPPSSSLGASPVCSAQFLPSAGSGSTPAMTITATSTGLSGVTFDLHNWATKFLGGSTSLYDKSASGYTLTLDTTALTANKTVTFLNATGTVGVIPTQVSGSALCETSTHTIGHCSSVVGAGGTCTCN